jgi:hypothetical protein
MAFHHFDRMEELRRERLFCVGSFEFLILASSQGKFVEAL